MPEPTELFVDIRTPLPGAEKAAGVHMQAHRAYHARLRNEGKLVMCGPLLDGSGALVVLSGDSQAEAEALTNDDPLVRYGLYHPNIKAWTVRFIRPSHVPAPSRSAVPGPKELFVDVRTPMPDTEKLRETHLSAHRAYLAGLRDEGKLLMSGPLKDGTGALVVLSANSQQDAEALVGNDPFVRYGVFRSRVIAWSVRTFREGVL